MYTVDQLQSMAVQFLMHQSAMDPRCDELIQRLQERTGFPPDRIVMEIHRLAMRMVA